MAVAGISSGYRNLFLCRSRYSVQTLAAS